MKKTDIFEQVVEIMREDSSTKKDIMGANPEEYRARITDQMSQEDFLYQMHCYIASFGILSHVWFGLKETQPPGFKLRYYQDCLYVLQANSDTGLKRGDQILALDGKPLPQVYQEHKNYFVSSTPERQHKEWAYFVEYAGKVTVVRNGKEEQLHVQPTAHPKKPPQFEWRNLSEDIVYLKLEDFTDEAAITQLYADSQAAIEQAKYLIIDVRVNYGGTDSLYYPLFKYTLPQGKAFSDLDLPNDDGMEILYTDRNVDLRQQLMQNILEDPNLSAETHQILKEFLKELEENRGKGYVLYGDEDSEQNFLPDVLGLARPEKVFVLADVTCGSSGDNFVDTMKKMPKVTVLGRPTMGILDYSNCCVKDFGDYELLFPTSRDTRIDQGKGMNDKGVEPDILIPWTPEHLERDVDLEECLNYCKNA